MLNSHALISVIIPCYNQGRYLATAINSVRSQTYRHYEIIVIDDGSDDNTKDIAEAFSEVIYVFQQNQGLAAARNTGIDHSRGEFLVFLDSDDWLLNTALETNLSYLLKKPEIAFVSGAHKIYYEQDRSWHDIIKDVENNHYCKLLESNYIAMIASVMFQRWIFDVFRFDTKLKLCEDYDLYLKIARKYSIYHHLEMMAVYYIHHNNSSNNSSMMLKSALFVLDRQKSTLTNDQEKYWFKSGQSFWKSWYTPIIYRKLVALRLENSAIDDLDVKTLRRYNKRLFIKFIKEKYSMSLRNGLLRTRANIGRLIPGYFFKMFGKSYVPKQGKVKMGDFNRTSPFSEQFGYDRGGPIDRYYIENFLKNNVLKIKGRVLEIGDNEYTLKYGGSCITTSDILHIDENNPKATFVGDLSSAVHIPGDIFDCIILTQTLDLIYDFRGAIETCYRILKPGGALLITVPGISHIGHDEWGKFWLWSFTGTSLKKMIAECFSIKMMEVETFGNVLVATAFLYGMGLPELKKEQLDKTDPHYQVIIAASAIK